MPAYNRRTREMVRAAKRQSERVVVCAGRRMFLAGGSPVGPALSGVRSQQAGVMPRRALKESRRLRAAQLHGEGLGRRIGKPPGSVPVACRAVRVWAWLCSVSLAQDRAPVVRRGLKGLRRNAGP